VPSRASIFRTACVDCAPSWRRLKAWCPADRGCSRTATGRGTPPIARTHDRYGGPSLSADSGPTVGRSGRHEPRSKRTSVESRRELGRASTAGAAQIWFLPLASDHPCDERGEPERDPSSKASMRPLASLWAATPRAGIAAHIERIRCEYTNWRDADAL
jgi:hypothetical protein